MLLEIIILILLLLTSGIFSMSEMAVVSARKSLLRQRAEEGDVGASTALSLAKEPTRFLSSMQIGITLISTLAGAFGGATLAREMSLQLQNHPYLGQYSDMVSVGAVVLAITYLNLLLAELVPKRLALSNPERVSSMLAAPMRAFSRMASPAISLLSISTDAIINILGVKSYSEPLVTEEEIRIMIDQGTTAGVFEEAEQDIVERVFRLGDRRAGAIMTPRTDIVWLDINDTAADIQRKITSGTFSLFPVCKGRLDNIIGMVQAKDLLSCTMKDQRVDLRSALLPPLIIPESMRALKILEKFKQTGIHLAMVIDEYGAVQGVVALSDIMEAIVGDIPHIEELAEPEIMQREDGSWLVDGSVAIEEFKEALALESLPEEENGLYQTVGGFVMMHLEKVPSTGDHFEWGGYRFEVVDMDEKRVDKLLVAPLKKDDANVI
jgi:putative hemolysin